MSERYGVCQACRGSGSRAEEECGRCGGTGFDGSAFPVEPFKKPKNKEKQRVDRAKTIDACIQAMKKHQKR